MQETDPHADQGRSARDAIANAPSLTELIEAWRRLGADTTDWASFEATPGCDRASVIQAWAVTDDPFAMLLLLAVMHPHANEPVCTALAARMSFSAVMGQIALMQRQVREGTRFNGPSPFVFTVFAHRVRHAMRNTAPSEQDALARTLSAAVREVVPDPYALDDDGAPALASSADKDRSASAFSCGAQVDVRANPPLQGTVRCVAWNYRFQCWTYWIANDHGEVATRYKAEDFGWVPQPRS